MNFEPETIDVILNLITVIIAVVGGSGFVVVRRGQQQAQGQFAEQTTTLNGARNQLRELQHDHQKAITEHGKLKDALKITQDAFDGLRRRFNTQETELNILRPLIAQVRVLRSELEALEIALKEERQKRIEAERQRQEIKEQLQRERESAQERDEATDKLIADLETRAQQLTRTVDGQKQQIEELGKLIETLTTPPPDPKPPKIIDPDFTPDKDEDAEKAS